MADRRDLQPELAGRLEAGQRDGSRVPVLRLVADHIDRGVTDFV